MIFVFDSKSVVDDLADRAVLSFISFLNNRRDVVPRFELIRRETTNNFWRGGRALDVEVKVVAEQVRNRLNQNEKASPNCRVPKTEGQCA